MNHSTPGLPVHHQLPEFIQTHVHRVRDAIQLSHPLPPSSPPTFNLSQHQGLCQWVNSLHQVTKVSELQLQHQSFQWTFRTISFRMDWFDLLVVQGTLKSLLQHHSSKASIFQRSDFFTVQLSHPYMTTGKTIALTKWTFVGKVMSLLFNVLSRLVVAFLPICTIKWLHDQMTWNYTTIKTDVKFLVLILYSDSVRCNCWAKLDERYMRLICFCSFLWIYNYFNIKIF